MLVIITSLKTLCEALNMDIALEIKLEITKVTHAALE